MHGQTGEKVQMRQSYYRMAGIGTECLRDTAGEADVLSSGRVKICFLLILLNFISPEFRLS